MHHIKTIRLASAPTFIPNPTHARLLGGGIKFTQANSFTSQSYTHTNTEKLLLHINFKPGNHTPLGMWRKGLFLQKNKKYLILLLSPEKFVILNIREHKLIKSAERRDTDASKRTGRDDIHKSKTVS